MGGYAWVTLATNNSYSLGALVLAHSLKKSNTAHKLVVLITPAVSEPMREQLQTVFDVVKMVDVLDSKDEAHLALMKRPDLGITFTKIHCWRLVEFEKCVFLDADTLVVRNCDELFEREEFSAAPDVSWPDCFNSGVFVYRPSVDTFNKLLQFAVENRSFDGGDQGLLNQFFSNWATEDIKKHLPFVYNLTSIATYSYLPAFKHYGSETRIVHFIGTGKPWLQQLDAATRTVTPTSGSEHLAPLLQQWWDLFCEKVHPNLDKSLESNNDGMPQPPVDACPNSVAIALTDEPQTARLTEPCTPYREKYDFRQHNLPYQPFDVKGSSGELLNVEFLLASAEEAKQDEQREGDKAEEATDSGGDEGGRNEEMEVRGAEEEFCEEGNKNERTKMEEADQNQQEEPPPPKDPFDYNSFFPDETCVNNYLEQNVVTYQPFEQQHQVASGEREPEQEVPSLPRFLTIPENDTRQSGNIETNMQEEYSPPRSDPPPEQCDPPPREPTPQREEPVLERRELAKSKSMSYLPGVVTATEAPPQRSIWKSQPNLSVDPNRRYSMPKLRPILPKQNSFSKSVPSAMPKVTLYTEFLMSSEYKDPEDLPMDKVGFVESYIHKEARLRRCKSDADIRSKFGPLPYALSPQVEKPVIPKKLPPRHLDNELYDFAQCKRQMGNKPKPKDSDRRENVPMLPALRPIAPAKDKKSTLIKKRKSKELSPGQGGREKMMKREPKIARERRRESKVTPRNVSTAANGKSLEEILQNLRELSKDYLHFFEVAPTSKETTVKCKNSAVQAGEEEGVECETSEAFETVSASVITRSRETQTAKEAKPDGVEFRHFRNYIKDKIETSQMGLLGIQDILSDHPGTENDDGTKSGDRIVRAETPTEQRGDETPTQEGTEEQTRHTPTKERSTGPKGYDLSIKEAAAVQNDYETPKEDATVKQRRHRPAKETLTAPKRDDCSIQEVSSVQNEDETPTQDTTAEQTGHTPKNETPTAPKGDDLSIQEAAAVQNEDEMLIQEATAEQRRRSPTKETPTAPKRDNPSIEEASTAQNEDETPAEDATAEQTGHTPTKETPTAPKDDFSTQEATASRNEDETSTQNATSEKIEDQTSTQEYSRSRSPSDNGRGDSEKVKPAEERESTNIPSSEDYNSTTESKSPAEVQSQVTFPESHSEPEVSRIPAPELPPEDVTKSAERSEIADNKSNDSFDSIELSSPEHRSSNEKVEETIQHSRKLSCDNPPLGVQGRNLEHNSSTEPKTPNQDEPNRNGFSCENTSEYFTAATEPVVSSPVITQNGLEGKMGVEKEPQQRRKEKLTNGVIRPKNPNEILCVPDFDTPRSSRVTIPTPQIVAEDVMADENRKSSPDRSGRTNGTDSPEGTVRIVGKNKSGKSAPSPDPSTTPQSNGNLEDDSGSGIAGAIAQLSLDAGPKTPESAAATAAHQEYVRRQNWETGNMDYMGRDSFDNIWSKICQTLEAKESEEAAGGSPKQTTAEEKKPEAIPPAQDLPQSVLQKCPEYIETLPGDPAAGPVEDDEIIFSKPEQNRQTCLTNISEAGESSEPAATVKLSDILKLETAVGGKSDKIPLGVAEIKAEGPAASPVKDQPQTTPAGEQKPPETPKAEQVPPPVAPAVETPAPVCEKSQAPATPTAEKVQPPTTTIAEKVQPPAPPAADKVQPPTTPAADKVQPPTTPTADKVQPPAPPAADKVQPPAPPAADKVQPPAPQAADKVQPPTTPAADKVQPPTTPTADKVQPPAPPAADKVQPPAPPAADKVQAPSTTTADNVQPPTTPAAEKVQPPSPPAAEKVQPPVTPTAEKALPETVPTEGKPPATPTALQGPLPATPTGEKIQPPTTPEGVKVQPSTGEQAPPPATPTAQQATPTPEKVQPPATATAEKAQPQTAATEGKPAEPAQSEKPADKATAIPPPTAQLPSPVGQPEPEKKPAECTTVAIPSPPIVFPGAPFADKGKPGPKGKKPEDKPEVKSEPIPLPPPESPTLAPTEEPTAKTSDSSKEEGKQKKGVFTKILEMVGVAPKEKNDSEAPKSVFYDAQGSVEEAKEVVQAKPEAEKTEGQKTSPPEKQEQGQAPMPKPARSSQEEKKPGDAIQVSPARKSPSPKLKMPEKPPETAITAPTPPPQSELPPRKSSGLLKVDETILETPPVADAPKETVAEAIKGKVDDIIGKAKTEVENLLQDRRSAEKEGEEGGDLINTMKLMVGAEEPEEVEELKVTSEEDRKRHKGEVVSSKLSDQILKAIPPPRRKAISEASASTSSIPKAAPEQKTPPGEGKTKPGKPSSIPVPPPRNKGKPTQPSPPKGKGKK